VSIFGAKYQQFLYCTLQSVLINVLYINKQINDSIHLELQTDCILDKIDEYRRNCVLHMQRMPQNRIPLKSYLYNPHGKRTIGRQRDDEESNFNSGDGMVQMAQPWMFMMMINKQEFYASSWR
jgi:hypothetical protein